VGLRIQNEAGKSGRKRESLWKSACVRSLACAHAAPRGRPLRARARALAARPKGEEGRRGPFPCPLCVERAPTTTSSSGAGPKRRVDDGDDECLACSGKHESSLAGRQPSGSNGGTAERNPFPACGALPPQPSFFSLNMDLPSPRSKVGLQMPLAPRSSLSLAPRTPGCSLLEPKGMITRRRLSRSTSLSLSRPFARPVL